MHRAIDRLPERGGGPGGLLVLPSHQVVADGKRSAWPSVAKEYGDHRDPQARVEEQQGGQMPELSRRLAWIPVAAARLRREQHVPSLALDHPEEAGALDDLSRRGQLHVAGVHEQVASRL